MICPRRLLVLTASFCLAVLALPALPAAAQPDPWFQVRPGDGIGGYAWSAWSSVDVSLETTPGTWNPLVTDIAVHGDGSWLWQPADPTTIPPAGSHVSVTDGSATRDLYIASLWVTEVNVDTDVVSGIATTGDTVWVAAEGGPPVELSDVTAGGSWSVDFSGLVDLQPWVIGGSAEIRDADGDSTAVGWAAPTPFVRALTWGSGAVYAHGWLPGSQVDLAVDKPGTESDLGETVTADQDGTVVWEFPEGSSLDVADIVTATSQDGLITRQVTVVDLGIDTIDPLTNTIYGHAPIGTPVHVSLSSGELGNVTRDGTENWEYVAGVDLLAEGGFSAEVADADGDFTEASFFARDHEEVSPPGPANGETFARTGLLVSYLSDVWVAYPADPSTFTVSWDWGDGTTSAGTVAFDQGDPSIATASGSHSYPKAGLYPVGVSVSQPGVDPAVSEDSDASYVAVFDPRRGATVRGTATVTAERNSGAYYDLSFAGGSVYLTIDARRAPRSMVLSGSATVSVPGMNDSAGMVFTTSGAGLQALFSDTANALGKEILLYAHGLVTNPGNPDSAAGTLIHIIDRAKAPDLVRIVIWDEGGAGYGILDTVRFEAPGDDPPWWSPPKYRISVANDQVTSSSLKIS